MIKGKGIIENISYKPSQGRARDKMLSCITQTDPLVLRDAEKEGRESKTELELATQTVNVILIYLYHHRMGLSKHTNTKIFKKLSITSKGHHGDNLPPQKDMNTTLQKSHACLPGQIP